MNPDHDPVLEEEISARLLAYDEVLARGGMPATLDNGEPGELRDRLERGLACLQLLQQLRPQKAAEVRDADRTRNLGAERRGEPLPVAEPMCPVHLGRFEIRRALGSGSFGIVYLAYDPTLCREVALKIPRAGALADAEGMARFQREARAAAGLDHPNLVPVYEAGQFGPVCYIALAYCPGNNLAEWLKLRAAPVACRPAAQLVRTLAQAIHYAHAHGVLHRDLKPSNVLLSPIARSEWPAQAIADGESGALGLWLPDAETGFLPRVTDFGLARLTASDQGQTQTGDVLGTPSYMSPEQAEGRIEDVSLTTDVYALGAILYEVVTGRPPFWAETSMATLWQVKTTEPPAPSRLRPDVPRDLDTICLKCLRKEPRRRYGSAEDLAEDLRRFLAGRPILARPTSRTEQVLKWAWRRPALSAALAALALVTALGIGGIFRQWQQTQDALAEEATAHRQAVFLQEQAQEAQQVEAAVRETAEIALYHHRVVLAHREWLAGNVGRASQLLNECQADRRDWEWRDVRRLCDHDLFTLGGHSAPVTSVVFSPDGHRLASVAGKWSSTDPGEVKLWEAATGKLLWTGLGHSGPVMGVAFSPDGRHLASACVSTQPTDGEIKIWGTATGKALQTLSGPRAGAFCVAFSPDGKLLASGGADQAVRLWDLETGRQVGLLKGHTSEVFGVAFSPDGRLLASAGWDGTARVWDAASRKLLHVLSGPADLRSVAFSPDCKRLVAASYNQSAKVWDVASGQVLCSYWGHTAAVLCATFTPDGRWVASSDSAGHVHIWDGQSGRPLRSVVGHTGPVCGVAFSPEGRRLATAGADRTIRIWDFTREQESLQPAGMGPSWNVAFSPDGKFLAAAGYRRSSGLAYKIVRVWLVDDFSRPRFWEGHTDWVSCVAFSPKGRLLASGSADKTIRLWDLVTGKTVHQLVDHQDRVTGVSFRADGQRLASASLDRTVKRWDVASGRVLLPVLTHPHPVRDVTYSPDGHRLVAVGDHGMARVWDADSGTELFDLQGHHAAVDRVLFSPDGHLLATASLDQSVQLWDMAAQPPAGQSLMPLRVLVGPSELTQSTGLAFSPNGRRLASSGPGHTIRLWDVVSGNETLTLRGHLDTVLGMAFSPNGSLFASASTRNIKIWEIGDGKRSTSSHRSPSAEREAIDWHRQQADECLAARPIEWFGVAFHVRRLLDANPDDWRLHLRRAEAKVELGQWQSAVDHCTRSILLGANKPWPWYLQAVGRLHLGDVSGYRQSCQDMLERFGQTEDPEQANDLAWACALAPAAVAQLDQAIHLATKATKADPASGVYRNTLGAVLYRADQLQAASESLREAIRLSNDEKPEDWLFLAMTCCRQGEKAEARRWLDKAIRWCDAAKNQNPFPAGQPPSRLTEIHLLCREARDLLALAVEVGDDAVQLERVKH